MSVTHITQAGVAAMIKDKFAENAGRFTFTTGAVILAAGFILTFLVSDKPFHKKA